MSGYRFGQLKNLSGTQIGPDGKRYPLGEVPSREEAEAMAEEDQDQVEMTSGPGEEFENDAEVGDREWAGATQNDSNADSPVREDVGVEQPEESSEEESNDDSDDEDEVAEKEANLEGVKDVEGDFPKHKGGGWYVTSDGNVVQGKDDAQKAEDKLEGNDD